MIPEPVKEILRLSDWKQIDALFWKLTPEEKTVAHYYLSIPSDLRPMRLEDNLCKEVLLVLPKKKQL